MSDPYEWHSVAGMVERDTAERMKALHPPMFISNPRQTEKSAFYEIWQAHMPDAEDGLGHHGPKAWDRLGRFKGMRDNPALTVFDTHPASPRHDEAMVVLRRQRVLDQAVRCWANRHPPESLKIAAKYGLLSWEAAAIGAHFARLWREQL